MAFKIPNLITKDWIHTNCRCQRREDRLLCQESCPVHSSFTEMTAVQRMCIEMTTDSMGLILHGHKEDKDA